MICKVFSWIKDKNAGEFCDLSSVSDVKSQEKSQLQKCSLAALGWEGRVKKHWKYGKFNTAEGGCATFPDSFAIGSKDSN